jgi:hypothetical protein
MSFGNSPMRARAAFMIALSVAVVVSGPTVAQEAQRFESPEAAASALVEAVASGDRAQILSVLGEDAEDVVLSGEPEVDAENLARFAAAASELERVALDTADGAATLYIGASQWPVPIPIVPDDDMWTFDIAAARDEILIRTLGANELAVIDLAAAYVRAQLEYRSRDLDGDGVQEFAQHVLSAPDDRDGLYWPTAEEGEEPSPFGPLIAVAAATGYELDGQPGEPEPYQGYFYRILRGQGENAPGGLYGYVINDNMVAGHALLAFPADYGRSGVMTFIVSENGVVLETDLGEATAETAASIDLYDPDDRWRPAGSD